MFGLSGVELAIILVLALLLLGPAKLPELARTLGKGLREFKKSTEDLRGSVESEFYRMDQSAPKAAPTAASLAAGPSSLTPIIAALDTPPTETTRTKPGHGTSAGEAEGEGVMSNPIALPPVAAAQVTPPADTPRREPGPEAPTGEAEGEGVVSNPIALPPVAAAQVTPPADTPRREPGPEAPTGEAEGSPAAPALKG